ncbi:MULTISPECIES: GNAT family protein [Peribacillus]|uniref:GCN5 family acetyltransferase n=1 Tax=Peribacillus simplex TaxID=1478 RepID=A0A125QSR9_9BACI|nr:GNAT family protein [Peribacillus simplex]KWW22602.1 GCN5 family acetyltransferase [Peribacillus simplex]
MNVKDIYGNLPVIESKRLIMRKVTMKDAEDMFAYASNREVSRFVTWDAHGSLSATKDYIQLILQNYEDSHIAPWGIQYKESGKLIGTIDYVSWQVNHHHAEIGYVLAPEYWGKGLMTEAVEKIVAFGFENMNLVRIQARCFVENTGSERVMQKAGMSFEGIIRKGMFVKGEHVDLKLYAIIK